MNEKSLGIIILISFLLYNTVTIRRHVDKKTFTVFKNIFYTRNVEMVLVLMSLLRAVLSGEN
jgi:hypothetical protein